MNTFLNLISGTKRLATLACFVVYGCSEGPPHRNPLDPASPEYTTAGRISGRVTGLYPPFRAVASAIVQLNGGERIAFSDPSGSFSFNDLPPDDYVVAVSATGLADTALTAVVLSREVTTVTLRLNGIPAFSAVQITSSRVATRESGTPRVFIEVSADVTDVDGAADIRRVIVHVPAMAFSDTLQRDQAGGTWRRLFSPDELVEIDLTRIVGEPFRIEAFDFPGATTLSAQHFLARLISDEPAPLTPTGGEDVTANPPVFVWQLANQPFAFRQRVEVIRLDAGFPARIAMIGNIAEDIRSLRYPGRLTSGTYFWTVALEDEFGNSSRSVESVFRVP